MRIQCPYCGERDCSEFVYLGDASVSRPDGLDPDSDRRFFDATYLRSNAAGSHEEFWYHVFGCRGWLRVIRDTRTHEISGVALALQADP